MNSVEERHWQARLAMAEQIGEARGAMEIALIWLRNSGAMANIDVQRVLSLLEASIESLAEPRREPKRSEAELQAAYEASVARIKEIDQEQGQ